jgi:pyruvate-formate lyase-activating enzyme
VARLRADYLASKPNISASRALADWETFRELAPMWNGIKHMDDEAHRRLTGAGNRRILDNLRGLFRMGKKVLIRMPLIPGLNDDPAGLEAAFAMLREEAVQGADIAGVELLPYHRYGEGKY